MKVIDFDKKFDEGEEDITQYIDLSKARRGGIEVKRVNVDFPEWMIGSLDKEASRLGVSRQSLIKFWVADKLQHTYDVNHK